MPRRKTLFIWYTWNAIQTNTCDKYLLDFFSVKEGITKYQNYYTVDFCCCCCCRCYCCCCCYFCCYCLSLLSSSSLSLCSLYIYVYSSMDITEIISILHNTQVSHNIAQQTPSYNFPARGKRRMRVSSGSQTIYAIHYSSSHSSFGHIYLYLTHIHIYMWNENITML